MADLLLYCAVLLVVVVVLLAIPRARMADAETRAALHRQQRVHRQHQVHALDAHRADRQAPPRHMPHAA